MRAVGADYQPRTMDQLEAAAILVLERYRGQTVRCGLIGEQMFPDAIHRGSAPFARIAGKVMRRLEAKGKAHHGKLHSRGEYGWYVP